MIVAVALSPAIDRTFVVARLDLGGVNRPTINSVSAGGKGVNVARVALALGAKDVTLAAIVDRAGEFLRSLDAEFADPDATGGGAPPCAPDDARPLLRRLLTIGPERARMCLSVTDVASGETTNFNEPAAPIDHDLWASFVHRLGAAIAAPGEATGWLALCGSAPDGIGPGAIAGLIDVARRNGWRVAVDTSGAPLREALSAGPDVVKVNAHEAAEIVGDGPPEVLVERLEVLAPTTVAIVTAGTDGAYARGIAARCDRHGRYPTGSGDAFLAALLTNLDGGALRHDRPRVHLPGALRAAVGAAAANAQRPGAGVVDARQAAAFSQDVIIT